MAIRPNFLADQAWGRRPKSVRRRVRATLACVGPVFYYFISTALISYIVHSTVTFSRTAPEITSLIVLANGYLFCTFLPLTLENRYSNARLLMANYHDYRLAGFSGREMLTGVAAPQLAGIKLFAIIYPATFVTALVYLSRTDLLGMFAKGFFGVILTGSGLFNLIAGSRFYLAQWAICDNKTARILKTLGMIFTCPITWCAFFPPLILLVTSFLEPAFTARHRSQEKAWKSAQALLDGNDYEPPPASTPTPPGTAT